MFGNALKRPALGQVASLGSLYDARSDSFVPVSLLNGPPPPSTVNITDIHTAEMKFSQIDSYKEKFERLGITAELSASFLAGLVTVDGSSSYLMDDRDSNNIVQASLHYNITTVHEKLNFAASEVKQCIAFKKMEDDIATHVVVEIAWGAHCVITAKHRLLDTETRSQVEDRLKLEFDNLKILNTSGDVDWDNANPEPDVDAKKSFEVTVYGDVLPEDGLPTDFEGAYKFVTNVPNCIAGSEGGKGRQMVYTLLPLNLLTFFLPIEVKADITTIQLSAECVEKFVQLFDGFRSACQTLNDYSLQIQSHSHCVPIEHTHAIGDLKHSARVAESGLKKNYANIMNAVRTGKADPQELWQLLKDSLVEDVTPGKIITAMKEYRKKMDFVDEIMKMGAKYIGYNSSSLEEELAKNKHPNVYIFYFNDQVRNDDQQWKDNVAHLFELLGQHEREKLVLVVDCDATGDNLERPYICHRLEGQTIIQDVVEQRKFIVDKSIILYDEKHLDRTHFGQPLKHRAVKIPCPGVDCNPNTRCEWICPACHTQVEYGFTDRYLYCDCGRCLYNYYIFKCNGSKHQSEKYEQYSDEKLLLLLNNMDPRDELNILILGETGVGKSTFINAFVNYLTFQSLEDAIEEDTVTSVIPCSFATQYVDETNDNGRLLQKEIKIGSNNDDEHDGTSGASATQKTTVHTVTIGACMVRLIDTPGIGDTRGVNQDQKNMADILSVLRSYEKLHGVLILLKPNNSRLTVTFKFCIKELLTHLHRNAASNMVFGFTNTRGSNYQPGDTFKPLETLLNKYEDVDIGLFQHTVYCFDSESFRYLAAHKQGVDMGNHDEYSRSWEHSVIESQRLLAHFRSLMPHEVKSTLNLNETRHLIAQLTKPMTEITQAIKASILVNEDHNEELSTKTLSGDELQKRLYVQKIHLHSRAIDMPRTVCGNADCIEFHDDGIDSSNPKLTTVYKTLCHNPCYLQNVEEDKVGISAIKNCAAFYGMGGQKCNRCGHNWQEHLHILYELHPETTIVMDKSVQKAISDNASHIDVVKTAIAAKKKMIDEFQVEHDTIRKAAVQFTIFLKKYSITPYNDATLEYLDFLIKDERAKVQVGGSPERLNSLQQYRGEYQELIQILTNNMKSASGNRGSELHNEEDVNNLIRNLYKLKHFGNNLQRIRDTVEFAHAATYREKPCKVKVGKHWGAQTTPNGRNGFVNNRSVGRLVEPFKKLLWGGGNEGTESSGGWSGGWSRRKEKRQNKQAFEDDSELSGVD